MEEEMRSSNTETDNMLIWLGTGIAQRRKAAGLNCSQLARKVRLTTDVIHRLELGESICRCENSTQSLARSGRNWATCCASDADGLL